ncbi:DUF4442 domain-containing protein [Castellaniella caeni]|uniref:DUF4442 domain-containing protein n=1 Tax=Castellaniella caeni TaxID=266123 RepID=UPI000835685B|nr:DUF4442 domain-containing protein [Castellaniella caeni]
MKLSQLSRLSPRWAARAMRMGFNLHPAFRATGGRVVFVAPDLLHIRVRLALTRRTRNLVGSIYGGSLFAVTDGVHAGMLMARLGSDVIVWDKAATIRYRKPAFHTLTADFRLSEAELRDIREALRRDHETERTYPVELKGPDGTVHTEVQRTLYLADKAWYKQHKLRHGAAGDPT